MCARRNKALVAANANVGVAKAAYFPQISLTGNSARPAPPSPAFCRGPRQSGLSAARWPSRSIEGGTITSAYHLAWAQRDQAELQYKQTVQQAFGDVANSLVWL